MNDKMPKECWLGEDPFGCVCYCVEGEGVKYIRADLAQPVKDKKSISDKLVTVLKRWDDEEEYVHKTLAEELIKALIEVGVIRVKE